MRFDTNSLPEPAINPLVQERTTKNIRVYIRFAGLLEKDIEVPADLNIKDRQAVANAIDDLPDPENIWHWTLGDMEYPGANCKSFADPCSFPETARVFLEGAEEE